MPRPVSITLGEMNGLRRAIYVGRGSHGHVVLVQCQCLHIGQMTVSEFVHRKFGACPRCKKPSVMTHGHSRHYHSSPTLEAYRGMKDRCLNPHSIYWKNYGGRGITVCDEWLHSFEAFLAYMGECPPGMSLDRYPNNDGNYEPGNVRWATRVQQNRNRRNNILITFNGVTKPRSAWAEETGIHWATLRARLGRLGWTIERALTTPAQGHRTTLQRFSQFKLL